MASEYFAKLLALRQLGANHILSRNLFYGTADDFIGFIRRNDEHAVHIAEYIIARPRANAAAFDSHVDIRDDRAALAVEGSRAGGEDWILHLANHLDVPDHPIRHAPSRSARLRGGAQQLAPG